VNSTADIIKVFTRSFFFGCEADDPMTAVAFNGTSGLPRLNAVFSSDIGHWDVPDMACVLCEAYEPVEHGHLSEDDFRAFTFEHIARFYNDANPALFDGTTVAEAARTLCALRRET
jgi:hypothetical protein